MKQFWIRTAGLALCLLVVPGLIWSAPNAAEQSWVRPNVDLSAYESVYVASIDLRDVRQQAMDDEDGGYYKVDLEPSVLEDLAHYLYNRYTKQLGAVLPVKESEVVPPGEKALIIDLKLKSLMTIEERGALTKWVLGEGVPKPGAQEFTVECSIKDARSSEEILRFTNRQQVYVQDVNKPFTMPQDFNEFDTIADRWAARTVRFLQHGEY